MLDGLGFRYYWTTEQTIDPILGLTTIIANAIQKKINIRSGKETSAMLFAQKWQLMLQQLKAARDLVPTQPDSVADYKHLFGNGIKTVSYPA